MGAEGGPYTLSFETFVAAVSLCRRHVPRQNAATDESAAVSVRRCHVTRESAATDEKGKRAF